MKYLLQKHILWSNFRIWKEGGKKLLDWGKKLSINKSRTMHVHVEILHVQSVPSPFFQKVYIFFQRFKPFFILHYQRSLSSSQDFFYDTYGVKNLWRGVKNFWDQSTFRLNLRSTISNQISCSRFHYHFSSHSYLIDMKSLVFYPLFKSFLPHLHLQKE